MEYRGHEVILQESLGTTQYNEDDTHYVVHKGESGLFYQASVLNVGDVYGTSSDQVLKDIKTMVDNYELVRNTGTH